MSVSAVSLPANDPNEHPLVHDVNQEHRDSLSPVEKACKTIADWTGAPLAVVLTVSSLRPSTRIRLPSSSRART